MKCPLCTGDLFRPEKLAVHECKDCKTRFFILVTSRPRSAAAPVALEEGVAEREG